MGMETVTNYTCDRCGLSEIKNGVTILTLTVRARTQNTPGQGKSVISKHVCQERCLKVVEQAMTPLGKPGRKKATATATKGGTKSASSPQARTKRSTKNGSAPRTSKITASPVPSVAETRAETVRAVRAITRKGGKYAPGYGPYQERQMIAERESINSGK